MFSNLRTDDDMRNSNGRKGERQLLLSSLEGPNLEAFKIPSRLMKGNHPHNGQLDHIYW